MNDTLVSPLNTPTTLPQAGPTGAAGKNNPESAAQPKRSFSDVAEALNDRPETKEKPRGHLEREIPEELAALLAAAQAQTQAASLQPRDEGMDAPQHETNVAAVDAGEADAVSIDREVKGSPPLAYELPRAADPADTRRALVKPIDDGNLTDTIFVNLDAPESRPERAVMEALRGTMTEEPFFQAGEKEMAASFMDMRARLAALTHVIGKDTDEAYAEPTDGTDLSDGMDATGIVSEADGLAEGLAESARASARETATGEHRPDAHTARPAGTAAKQSVVQTAERHGQLFASLQTAAVERAAGTPAETPVSPSQIIRQIVETTAVSQTGSISQIKMQLNPEFLGKVSIVLTTDGDGLSARIQAQSDTVRDMLASNLLKLQSELRDMGINMKYIDIAGSGLGGALSHGEYGGRPYGQNTDAFGTPGARPVTMARFHQAVRAPMALDYDRPHDGYTGGDAGGVDFWA